ncbi:formylglycine-generating enzyme family protein [Sorangium sp. So ce854]|uniref:formylglycine-generating enzyme family protein n=1 Tax=Sorangium sp. So ce854 TaxID=3133322 RepID=UPI003F5FD20E
MRSPTTPLPHASLFLAAAMCGVLAAACGASPATPDGPPPAAPAPAAQAVPGGAAAASTAAPAPDPAATAASAQPGGDPVSAQPGAGQTSAPAGAGAAAASAAPEAPSDGCPEGMARVPGGSFVMGPLKVKATVGDLCMDRTEVTADAYAACVTSGKCTDTFANCAKEASTYGVAGKEKQPMVCVDFAQAQAYCAAQGKRLPRDDEWEWAARGGEAARPYPWGDEAPKDQLCWSGGGAVRKTACDVGSFPAGANPQGIQDLAGNVFEWTTSANDGSGKMRVARGGSWRDGIPPLVRTARPGGFEATYRCGFLGIRCVMEPAAKAAP